MGVSKYVIALSALASFSGSAIASIADFFIADASGGVYSVNGETLEASQVFTIEGGYAINDIMYGGSNKMLANVTGQLIQFDMTTGTETVIFDMRELHGGTGNYYTSGLARTSSDEIFFSVNAVTAGPAERYGATFDPFTGIYTQLPDFDSGISLYFDHFDIGNGRVLGADYESGEIDIIDTHTGVIEESHATEYGPVSFFQAGDSIMTLSRAGDLYTFNEVTGESAFYGHITGNTLELIGATSYDNPFIIPSPGTLSMLGLGSLMVTRRRR